MGRLKIAVSASFCFIFLVSLVSLIPATSYAMADPVLPPRPTPDPTTAALKSVGATIMLHIPLEAQTSTDADDWAVVQWQNKKGVWTNVAGWQGNLTYNTASKSWEVVWWVDRANFGEKSFRWVIYSDDTMTTLESISHPFDLPKSQYEAVVVGLKE